uniref:Uncharacterized protein n=1 Tax=Octopus bimaculoides TaxID=37653 RepID=A0A0L8H504_OCTBM
MNVFDFTVEEQTIFDRIINIFSWRWVTLHKPVWLKGTNHMTFGKRERKTRKQWPIGIFCNICFW